MERRRSVLQVRCVIIAQAVALAILTACSSGTNPAGQGTSSSSPKSLVLVSHDEPGPGPASAIQETMRDVKYKLDDLNVKAGRFVVHLVNQETPPPNACLGGTSSDFCWSHEMRITDANGKDLAASATIKPGADGVFVIDDLPAGSYLFYCGIKDHTARGMKGAITVAAS
jgi:plastocyanin